MCGLCECVWMDAYGRSQCSRSRKWQSICRVFFCNKLKQKSWNADIKPVKKLAVQIYLMSTLLAYFNSLICASTSIKICVCVSRVTQTICWNLVCCHKFTPSAFVHPSHSFCRWRFCGFTSIQCFSAVSAGRWSICDLKIMFCVVISGSVH